MNTKVSKTEYNNRQKKYKHTGRSNSHIHILSRAWALHNFKFFFSFISCGLMLQYNSIVCDLKEAQNVNTVQKN